MTKAGGATATRTLSSDSQLLQDYLQSAGILVNTGDDCAGKVTAFQNAEGQTEAIVIDPQGSIYHVCREPLSDSGWNMYGIGAGFQMIAAVDAATLWAVGNDGDLWRGDHGRWTLTQAMPSGRLTLAVSVGSDGTVWAVDALGGLFVKGPAAALTAPQIDGTIAPILTGDASGRTFVCVDTRGALWAIRQPQLGGGWSAWTSLGAPAAGVTLKRIALGTSGVDCLQIFAIGSDATPYTIGQQGSAEPWSSWAPLGENPPRVGALAVAGNVDGRLEVFAVVNSDSSTGCGTISHIWQTAPNGGWSGWADMPLPPSTLASDLTAVRDLAGCLQIVATGDPTVTTGLWAKQAAPGQAWTAWQPVGGAPAPASPGSPVLTVNADGTPELFALDQAHALWHIRQANGAWTGEWQSLGGVCGPLALCQDPGGRLQIFTASQHGALWHIGRTSPGGGWSVWQSLHAPTGDTVVNMTAAVDPTGAFEVLAVGASHASWRIARKSP